MVQNQHADSGQQHDAIADLLQVAAQPAENRFGEKAGKTPGFIQEVSSILQGELRSVTSVDSVMADRSPTMASLQGDIPSQKAVEPVSFTE